MPAIGAIGTVPVFGPIRAGGGRRVGRLLRRRRRVLAAGLAMTAAALAAVTPVRPPAGPAVPPRPAPLEGLVRAPVRIADGEVARLLEPGDRIDVLAGSEVVAKKVSVVRVPTGPASTGDGALLLLSVPRATAAALMGAAADIPLAVTLY